MKFFLLVLFLCSSAVYAVDMYIDGKKQSVDIDAFTYDGVSIRLTTKSSSGGSSGGSGGGSSGGGGVAGNDPGLGQKWLTSYQGKKVFVVDRSAYGNRTYFPGCMTKYWPEQGLSHGFSLSPLAGSIGKSCRSDHSLRAGEIYSVRVPLKMGNEGFGSIKLARAEAGEAGGQVYDIALSSTPGDLNPTEFANDRCVKKGITDGTLTLMPRRVWVTLSSRDQRVYCPVEENKVYYFNFAPALGTRGATDCGKGGYICRVQYITDIPAAYYQDVRVKSESY